VTHLRCGVEPALDVELKVVSAGTAVRDERSDGDKREQRKQDRRPCSRKALRGTTHAVSLAERKKQERSIRALEPA
jgi:hypothetical protein